MSFLNVESFDEFDFRFESSNDINEFTNKFHVTRDDVQNDVQNKNIFDNIYYCSIYFLAVHETLNTLKWKFNSHPKYSPAIAPSGYQLFRSMALGLAEQRFFKVEDIEKWVDLWITSKDQEFLDRRGIHILPERWAKVLASDDLTTLNNAFNQFIIEINIFNSLFSTKKKKTTFT